MGGIGSGFHGHSGIDGYHGGSAPKNGFGNKPRPTTPEEKRSAEGKRYEKKYNMTTADAIKIMRQDNNRLSGKKDDPKISERIKKNNTIISRLKKSGGSVSSLPSYVHDLVRKMANTKHTEKDIETEQEEKEAPRVAWSDFMGWVIPQPTPMSAEKGGPGSGNFGHSGRPGHVGGSAGGGGKSSGKPAFDPHGLTQSRSAVIPKKTGGFGGNTPEGLPKGYEKMSPEEFHESYTKMHGITSAPERQREPLDSYKKRIVKLHTGTTDEDYYEAVGVKLTDGRESNPNREGVREGWSGHERRVAQRGWSVAQKYVANALTKKKLDKSVSDYQQLDNYGKDLFKRRLEQAVKWEGSRAQSRAKKILDAISKVSA